VFNKKCQIGYSFFLFANPYRALDAATRRFYLL